MREPIPKPTKHQRAGATREQHAKRVAHEKASGYRGSKKREWVKLRNSFLAQHAKENGWWVCWHCFVWTQAPEVDHIIKRSVAPDRVLDITNLQILCHNCHLQKDSGMKIK